jgi:hypothetical protein
MTRAQSVREAVMLAVEIGSFCLLVVPWWVGARMRAV